MEDVSYLERLYKGHADGMVSGAAIQAHTILPALVKNKPNSSVVSSIFYV
jgi:phosphotransacetylase